MSKYIDAEVITGTIRKVRTRFAIGSVFGENLREDAAAAGALEAVAQVIDLMPAADVQEVVKEWCYERNCVIVAREDFPRLEVRHGKWKQVGDNTYRCSVCGEISCCNSLFCSECGAKMDGEEE